MRRRFIRSAVLLVAALLVVVVATRLPAIDPQYLVSGEGRPILGGALLALLGSSILIGLAWMRRSTQR